MVSYIVLLNGHKDLVHKLTCTGGFPLQFFFISPSEVHIKKSNNKCQKESCKD